MSLVSLTKHGAWPSVIARSPERAVVALILAFLVFRVVLAANLGLGVDESYGIGVSHDFKLSYFDHPPLSCWIVHVFIPLLGEGRALRLPFIALFAGTTWTVYLFTRQMFGATAGVWAVLALNLSAFFTLSGGWILPDGPLLLCLAAAACTIAHGLFSTERAVSPWRTWLIAGFWIGLAGLSKYHVRCFSLGYSFICSICRKGGSCCGMERRGPALCSHLLLSCRSWSGTPNIIGSRSSIKAVERAVPAAFQKLGNSWLISVASSFGWHPGCSCRWSWPATRPFAKAGPTIAPGSVFASAFRRS